MTPTALPVNVSSIPSELQRLPQWVAWKWEVVDDKWTKPPYDIKTGALASVTDPSTWASFEAARAVLDFGLYDGIGFVLTREAGIVGIDLDHCDDPTTASGWAWWALTIVDQLNGYTERSPSGKGLRIFVRGSLPPGGRKKGAVEFYVERRYLTVTGQHLADTPTMIDDRDATLQYVYRATFPAPEHGGNGQGTRPIQPVDLDDAALIEKMSRATNGAKVYALWCGNFSAYPSQSEADAALCASLAFWTGRDAARMDRLFRASGLMRDKWDARHYGDGRTYGEATIAHACEGCTDTFTTRSDARRPADDETPEPEPEPEPEREGIVLDAVHAFLGRFVVYPSPHAHIAHTLWIAHTHCMEKWESTPRLSFLSPEPSSGKTRAMEATEPLVPRPVEAINTTPAYLFRKVADPAGLPTILYDEIDTLFGPKAKEHEEIRALLNAGHRRGAKAGRCVVKGKTIMTEELEAFAPVALAGLGNLPETILSRSIVINMRRRAPTEVVEPYRRRNAQDGHAIRARLEAWAASILPTLCDPLMPPEITDRDADCWEALLSVADAAGGDWPRLAREAAVAIVTTPKSHPDSLRLRLLGDLRTIFEDRDHMPTYDILAALADLEEAPWGDLKGKALDARRLANFLKPYGVESKVIRIGGKTFRGYSRESLWDAWTRYLPELVKEHEEHEKHDPDPDTHDIPDVTDVTPSLEGTETETEVDEPWL